MTIELGSVGHFGLAVSDVARSERFWRSNFDLEEIFRFEDGVGFSKGEPGPQVIGHMSFHLQNMEALRAALEQLKRNGVEVEDPGDEIGPESPGSPHCGLWFHDPDGYRWELSVQNALPDSNREVQGRPL